MAASSYYSTVQKAYIAFYGRPADPNGLTYWAARIDAAGGNISSIIQAFGTSAEATSLFGGVSNASAVNTLYNQIFGRDADITGLNFYVNKLLDGTYTLVDVAQRIIDGASGADATIVTNKLSAAQSFTDAIDTAAELIGYSGDASAQTARDWLSTVDSTSASVTAATGTLSATLTSIVETGGVSGNTYTLTTGADDVTGTSGNDTFTAGAGKLSSSDVLDGGAGRDTLSVSLLDEDAAPSLRNIEQIDVSFRNASASLDLADATGYTAVTVSGTTVGTVSNIADGSKVELSDYDTTVDVNITSDLPQTTANSITVEISGTSSGGVDLNDGFETLTLEMTSDYVSTGAAVWDLGGVKTLNVTGDGDLKLDASTAFSAAAGVLATVDASNAGGAVTLVMDGANWSTAMNITGSDQADTFAFSATLSSLDTVDGGAGNDTVTAVINATSTVRPTISNVETLTTTFAAAGTVDARAIDGVTTLNVINSAADATFTRVSDVTTINFASDTTGDDASITYATGTDLDVTVNLGRTVTTATDTFSAGDITVAQNGGSLTINAVGSGAAVADAITVNGASDLTINANTVGLTMSALAATAAASFDFNATNAVTVGAISVGKATVIDISATGTAATVALGAITGSKADSLSVSVSGADGDDLSIDGLSLEGSAISTIDLSSTSTASDINLGTLSIAGGTAATLDISGAVASGAVLSAIFSFASAVTPTASLLDISATFTGEGQVDVDFVEGATSTTPIGDLVIDASGITSAGYVSATLSLFGTTASTIEVTGSFGADTITLTDGGSSNTVHGGNGADTISGGSSADEIYGEADADSISGAAGNDYIDGGAGNDTLNGGAGNDTILGGAGANRFIINTGADGSDTFELLASTASTAADTFVVASAHGAGILGVDTIVGARAGDKIEFSDFTANVTAAADFGKFGSGAAGLATGAVTYGSGFRSAAFGTVGSANQGEIAIYSNGADTVIEVVVSSAVGVSAIQTFVLDSVALNSHVSAQFRIDINADSGLMITLL